MVFEEFLAGQLDVFAERLGDFDAGLGQFGFEQLLEHRHAGTAAGSGAGAALQLAEFLDGGVAVAGPAAVDGVADGSGGDVVAGTQDGVVRQFGVRGVAAAGRGEVGAGFGRQFAAQHGAQGRVRRGVADEDAAEQGLGIVRGDDLLVDAAGRVGVDDFERVLGAGEGVAEAGDVDAGELELGGRVEAREVASPPCSRSATISAIVLAGATRPRHMPPKLATSPIAQMPGTCVSQPSEMTTPPRGPRSNSVRIACIR